MSGVKLTEMCLRDEIYTFSRRFCMYAPTFQKSSKISDVQRTPSLLLIKYGKLEKQFCDKHFRD